MAGKDKKQDPPRTAAQLLAVVGELAREMHPSRAAVAPTLDCSLDRDLGFDSLGRTELILRLERTFHVSLSDRTMVAETSRDLLRAVLAANGKGGEAVERLRLPQDDAATVWPVHAPTLLHALDWHLEAHPDRVHVHLEGENGGETLTYRDVYSGASAIAAGLQSWGLAPGDAVAIMLPTGREYLWSFLGTLLAGGVPVPIYPPLRPSQLEEHLRRHARILASAEAVLLITVPEAINFARLLKPHVPSLRRVVSAEALGNTTAEPLRRVPQPAETALLQYTSGSTGQPKGVIVSHANIIANMRAAVSRIEATPADVFVSWLPLYHDMGLIGAWLGSLLVGVRLVLMSPLRFLARPGRWLWAIHEHRGTLSAAPNFAYELCLHKVPDNELEGLDLSSWRLALNGAEPVRAETLAAFVERYSSYGFAATAPAPVYGLAESTLAVTMPRPGTGVVADRICRETFRRAGYAAPARTDDANPLIFAACGEPVAGHEVRVVNALGLEVEERQEGRLYFRGPSSTSGYYRNPAATQTLFAGDWLDTGDRAYLAAGLLYVTGRDKELIICSGRNIYPYELEQSVGEIQGVRKGCVAVFGAHREGSGTERLVVVAEVKETNVEMQARLRRAIEDAAVDLYSIPPDDVLLVRPHTVLKTSSGKIRRTAMRDLYERGAVGKRGAGLWWQIARLLAAAGASQLRRATRIAAELTYGVYVLSLAAVLIVPAAVAIIVLPRADWRFRFVRAGIRSLLRLARLPFIVRGAEHVPADEPFIAVANHSSYTDALVLWAALPREVSFVAKSELEHVPILGLLLKRLGVLFVRRFDRKHSTEDAAHVAERVRGGCSAVFFPEGTFARQPGLLPFRMGAFRSAAEAGVPVLPTVLRGTRAVLPDGAWLPRRRSLTVLFLPLLRPAGGDWQAVARLKQEARAAILQHNGEPDLDRES